MRNIKFRGKATKDYPEHNIKKGDWVYGYFIEASSECGIAVTEGLDYIFGGVTVTKVDCKTVGQFMGLMDKNKKKIYEGDVVKWINLYGEINIGWIRYTKVLGGFSVVLIKGSYHPFYTGMVKNFGWSDLEIIGNIFENPELKGDENG